MRGDRHRKNTCRAAAALEGLGFEVLGLKGMPVEATAVEWKGLPHNQGHDK